MPKKIIKKPNHIPRVSIIIPVYNCEQYLERCLDSVFSQTYQDFDVIAVNDGSTDSSLAILKRAAKKHRNLTVIDQKNHGQGYTRNRQLDTASGEYILFVDSDDFLEPLTLELAITRADNDKSDFVHFDWKLTSNDPDRPHAFVYRNAEPFAHKDELIGAECEEMLGANTFYTVANLYRRSFLNQHNIRYDEGYIYEDVIFMVKAVSSANKISLIQSPLYNVQRNLTSTTRSNTTTDKHYKHFLRAVKKSFEALNPRGRHSTFYLAGYLLASFAAYYHKRIPARLRSAFAKDFVDILSGVEIVPVNEAGRRYLLRKMIELNIFKEKKYLLFRLMINYKKKLLPRRKKIIGKARGVKHHLINRQVIKYRYLMTKPIVKGSIVFFGFDYRYTGNSRYLFEQIINDKRFKNRQIKFVTEDELVDAKYRISPNTGQYFEGLAQAEIIIAESWIPGNIKKRRGATWIQLWHGLPLKRMMFDSTEVEAVKRNDRHKIAKYNNILNWDYLLTDSQINADKFASAFLFPRERMVQAGYPRVKYLLDNHGDKRLKKQIKEKLGFDNKLLSKKVVLYAPTWRDYNRANSESKDNSYLLNINKLADKLGDDYLILYADHHFMQSISGALHKNSMDVSEYESQELLHIADYLITDYSSIMFDAFAINLPVILYVNDFKRYQKSRGIYPDMWADLKVLSVDSVNNTAKRIKNYKSTKEYKQLTAKYSYDSKEDLLGFIEQLKQ